MAQPIAINSLDPISGSIQLNNISYAIETENRDYINNYGSAIWAPEYPAQNGVVFIKQSDAAGRGPEGIPLFWTSDSTSSADIVAAANKLPGSPRNFTNTGSAYSWSLANGFFINDPNEPYQAIDADGMVFYLDAGKINSYPTTGSQWYNLSRISSSGSLANGPTFNPNGYIVFDGVDDYINLSSILTLSGSFTWTINCKSNLMSSTQNRQVYLGGSSTWFEQSDNDTFFIVNSPLLNLELPIGLLPQNRFYNITLTRKIDNTFDFYYNGVKQILRSGGTTPISASFILNRIGSVGSGGRYWNGSMSNIIVYNKLLNDNEILQNYHQAPIVTDGLVLAVDAGNLVSYESGSTTTYSLTGSITGSLINGVSYLPINNGTWNFDGTDDYINTSLSSTLQFLGTSSYSIEVWAKQAVTQSGFPMLASSENSIGVGRDGVNLTLNMPNTSSVRLIHERFASNIQRSTSITFPVGSIVGTPFQMVITYDGLNMQAYGNTIASSTTTFTGSITNTTTSFKIGSRGSGAGNRFNGNIYLVRVYDRALTQQEITQNFNAQRQRFGI